MQGTKKRKREILWMTSTLGLIGLMVIGAIVAIDSGDIDDICSTDDKILKRISGVWICADDETGSGSTNANETLIYAYNCVGTCETLIIAHN